MSQLNWVFPKWSFNRNVFFWFLYNGSYPDESALYENQRVKLIQYKICKSF